MQYRTSQTLHQWIDNLHRDPLFFPSIEEVDKFLQDLPLDSAELDQLALEDLSTKGTTTQLMLVSE